MRWRSSAAERKHNSSLIYMPSRKDNPATLPPATHQIDTLINLPSNTNLAATHMISV
jgi:hypothetical protein